MRKPRTRFRLFWAAPVAFFCGLLTDLAWWYVCHLNAQQRRDYHDYMLGKPL